MRPLLLALALLLAGCTAPVGSPVRLEPVTLQVSVLDPSPDGAVLVKTVRGTVLLLPDGRVTLPLTDVRLLALTPEVLLVHDGDRLYPVPVEALTPAVLAQTVHLQEGAMPLAVALRLGRPLLAEGVRPMPWHPHAASGGVLLGGRLVVAPVAGELRLVELPEEPGGPPRPVSLRARGGRLSVEPWTHAAEVPLQGTRIDGLVLDADAGVTLVETNDHHLLLPSRLLPGLGPGDAVHLELPPTTGRLLAIANYVLTLETPDGLLQVPAETVPALESLRVRVRDERDDPVTVPLPAALALADRRGVQVLADPKDLHRLSGGAGRGIVLGPHGANTLLLATQGSGLGLYEFAAEEARGHGPGTPIAFAWTAAGWSVGSWDAPVRGGARLQPTAAPAEPAPPAHEPQPPRRLESPGRGRP